MPSNSSEIDALLRSRPQKVVPAAFLFDESTFAKSAEVYLHRIRDQELKQVVLSGGVANGLQVVGQFFASGYHQAIAPITLMDDVPGWCVWFLSDETTSPDAFSQQVRALDNVRPGQFHHLLFLKTTEQSKAKNWISRASENRCLPFLLDVHGAMDRRDTDLARAAVAYVYSGWKKYWEAGDANLATALALPHDSRVLTLGMGASELDVEYHSQRWSEKVLDLLRGQLLAKTQKADSPLLKGIKDFFAFLLPDWYLATEEGGNPRSVDVRMGDESTTLHYLERKRKRLDVSLSHRRHFQHLLVRLKDKFCFLTFIALANARRFVEKKAKGLKDEVWPPVRDYLQLPDKADSLIHVLTQRVKHCADYAEAMRDIQAAGDAPAGSFQQDYKNAWTRISAIPNLLGATLRLALIAIGLAGLLLAPFWWGGVRHPLADDLLRNVALGSALLLIVAVVGVVIHYYYACRAADHHMELAETNLELRHLREIGGLAIEEVRKEGNALQKIVDDLREGLDSLADGIKKTAVKPRPAAKSPTGTWLSDNSVDVLMQPRLAELAHQAYTRVASELNRVKNESGLVRLEPALWQELLAKHAVAVSAEAIELLTFDQCVAAMGPSTSQKDSLLHNLVRESSQPAWSSKPDAESPVLCFADPDQWRAHCGQHDTVKFYKLHLKDMLMVSVIPLREFAP
jgi:hypothetical protein